MTLRPTKPLYVSSSVVPLLVLMLGSCRTTTMAHPPLPETLSCLSSLVPSPPPLSPTSSTSRLTLSIDPPLPISRLCKP